MDDKMRGDFCNALAETANVSRACEIAGVPRRTVYDWRKADQAFQQAWDEALELGSDALEDEAIRRGKDGVDKPVYQGGKLVGTIREYSDTLLLATLKARRPEKFKDRVNVTLRRPGDMTDEELAAAAADADAAAAALEGLRGSLPEGTEAKKH